MQYFYSRLHRQGGGVMIPALLLWTHRRSGPRRVPDYDVYRKKVAEFYHIVIYVNEKKQWKMDNITIPVIFPTKMYLALFLLTSISVCYSTSFMNLQELFTLLSALNAG